MGAVTGLWRMPRVAIVGWVAALLLVMLPAITAVTDADLGYRDHYYLGAGIKDEATSNKAESKLWFNDGWWATMFHPASNTHHIYRLDRSTERWIDTGMPIDTVPERRADTLWDPATRKLYVASHRLAPGSNDAHPPDIPNPPVSAIPGRLFRYSYSPDTNRYTLDPGFPVAINRFDSESLTIAKDSTGTLWATWTSADRVWVNHTVGADDAWGRP